VVTIAEAASEPYEGVLVCVSDINDVDVPHNCRNDDLACNDSDLWEISGPNASVVVYD